MIEIYDYQESDIENMDFNRYAASIIKSNTFEAIKNYLATSYSYTLFDIKLNRPIAILSFHEYEPDNYDGCIIADKSFGKTPKYAAKMRYLIKCVKKDYKAKRVQTLSEDIPKLNKWHEFLGFRLEKSLPGYINGHDFILWSM